MFWEGFLSSWTTASTFSSASASLAKKQCALGFLLFLRSLLGHGLLVFDIYPVLFFPLLFSSSSSTLYSYILLGGSFLLLDIISCSTHFGSIHMILDSAIYNFKNSSLPDGVNSPLYSLV
ncbi:hypothetical protein J3F84DRAFT_44433 [Trichoderma pleuroticola]